MEERRERIDEVHDSVGGRRVVHCRTVEERLCEVARERERSNLSPHVYIRVHAFVCALSGASD